MFGHGLESKTSEVRAIRSKHPDGQGFVVFVETLGFDDPNRLDCEMLAEIAGWIVKV